MVAFGFESGSDEMLRTLKKGTTVEMNLRAARWCHEVGLPFWGFYVIGFPWETREHILETRKMIMQQKPDFIEVKMALPFYGTELTKPPRRWILSPIHLSGVIFSTPRSRAQSICRRMKWRSSARRYSSDSICAPATY